MAVIKFGSIVTSGRGSLGGSTIQPCHSGHIWRNKPTPTKSRTQAQSLIRSYNKAMQAGWKALSDQDRQIWNNYAKEKPVFNRTGEKHPISGHSLWLKYQFDALQKGAPFMSDPSEYPGPYYGPEMLVNQYFATDTDWVKNPETTISGNQLHLLFTGAGYVSSYQQCGVIPSGIEHRFQVVCANKSGLIYVGSGGTPWKPIFDGDHVYLISPVATYSRFYFLLNNAASADISFVSLKRIYP